MSLVQRLISWTYGQKAAPKQGILIISLRNRLIIHIVMSISIKSPQ